MTNNVSLNKKEIFKRTELLKDLNDEALDFLSAHALEKGLARNEVLFLAGDKADGLYVIAEGSVRAFRTGMDGREQVIHVEHAVTTIAEPPVFDDGNYPSTVAAETNARMLFLPKDKVIAACLAHPALALAGARLLAKRLRHCAELVESLSLREVGQRLAQQLLKEARTTGKTSDEGVKFTQSLTHNQLAARIGTVREVVTRVMFRLQQQGLVKIDGKNVTIPDIEALAVYADTELPPV